MAKRKAVGKKARFEVFKRDGFTCQYCGAHPPQVVLHCDHIVAVADGGGNEQDNLITACDGCNLGKGATPLESIPQALADKAAEIAEREEQIRGYSEIMAARRTRIDQESWEVARVMMESYETEDFVKAWRQSIKRFIERLGVAECILAMELAVQRVNDSEEDTFRYFCGICWKQIKGASGEG